MRLILCCLIFTIPLFSLDLEDLRDYINSSFKSSFKFKLDGPTIDDDIDKIINHIEKYNNSPFVEVTQLIDCVTDNPIHEASIFGYFEEGVVRKVRAIKNKDNLYDIMHNFNEYLYNFVIKDVCYQPLLRTPHNKEKVSLLFTSVITIFLIDEYKEY